MNNNVYRSFQEAKLYVRTLKITSRAKYRRWANSEFCPQDIPLDPDKKYEQHGWLGWNDFLGSSFRSFEEAKRFVQDLKLEGKSDWVSWAKSRHKPFDIPMAPQRAYIKKGWKGWGDFLGNSKIANQNRFFRSFEDAKQFTQSLKLNGQSAWMDWSKSKARPSDIPAAPSRTYANKGWKDWGDFLGTGRVASKKRKFKAFSDARAFVHSLQLDGVQAWESWSKSELRPYDIPSSPKRVYAADGWLDWGDFLGTNRIANQKRKFIPFKKARKKAHALGFLGRNEWVAWVKTKSRPDNIPSAPDVAYSNKGWKGWGDFLGTGTIGPTAYRYRPYDEAKKYVQNLGLKNSLEWRQWSKLQERPKDIPALPSRTYAGKGWQNWGEFLGTGRVANQNLRFKPFQEARIYVRSLNLKNSAEWSLWAKASAKVNNIPLTPHQVYDESGWISWMDFLGMEGAHKNRKFMSYQEAKNFASSLGLKSRGEWIAFAKTPEKPSDIPTYPNEHYAKKGWSGWGEFLGTGRVANQKQKYLSFKEARAFAWNLGLNGKNEWANHWKKNDLPDDLPAFPDGVYKNEGWLGWGNFLGTPKHNSRMNSAGAKKIEEYLKEKNVKYIKEKTFEGLLKGNKGRSLRYDFFLPDYNLLIEFHGKQHFQPITSMGGDEGFEILKMHDQRKESFAISSGYLFFMINYQNENKIELLFDVKLTEIIESMK